MNKKRLNRRGFLWTGISGAAGIALSPTVVPPFAQIRDEDIIFRTLGRKGLKVPVELRT